MKIICILSCCTIIQCALTVSAQQAPKLAIVGVEAAPILARKYAGGSQVVTRPQTAANFEGTWRGTWRVKRQSVPLALVIPKPTDTAARAELKNLNTGLSWVATASQCNGTHINLTLPINGWRLEGDVDAAAGKMSAQWTRDSQTYPVTFFRQPGTADSPTAPAEPAVSTLDELIHAIDVQLIDTVEKAQMFTVIEDADLRHTVDGTSDGAYNLKNPTVAARFKAAGINYLLVTTVEDFQDQTVDMAQGRVAYQQSAANQQYSTRSSGFGGAQRVPGQSQYYRGSASDGAISSSSLRTQATFDPHAKKQQNIRLTVRSRIYDARTGALRDSANYSFSTNRTYTVAAQGNNTLSPTDLIEAAAKNVSDWTATRLSEGIFPIKVLDTDGKEITINRGLEAGLQVGQPYRVYAAGKEIKDPESGEVLGYDEVTIGRVAVTDLHEKFSKARILEDKGIAPGNLLRRITAR